MSDGFSLLPGDVLRVERRYLVDGVVSTTTAQGRFAGVERIGSTEHLVLRDEDGTVRMIPLSSVSEMVLVEAVQREAAAAAAAANAPRASWDPAVA